MTCSCKLCQPCDKMSTICLGRCDLPKHKCLKKRDVKPGPIPKYMGWHYTAKHSPEHQLRCGWRPGHIFCPVLRRIEQHNCMKSDSTCGYSNTSRTNTRNQPKRISRGPSSSDYPPSLRGSYCSGMQSPRCTGNCPHAQAASSQGTQPYIRITRRNGQYTICTKPSNMTNAPSSPFPLKYVLNLDPDDEQKEGVKYSIEAKFNDNQFDYISSQTSFVLDFTPPEQRCYKSCPRAALFSSPNIC